MKRNIRQLLAWPFAVVAMTTFVLMLTIRYIGYLLIYPAGFLIAIVTLVRDGKWECKQVILGFKEMFGGL
ncbi:hypothetical protein C8D76_103130 [Pasteurella langaaensis DSM 22999]|uniref:Uncharacterized protein n=1 Tax=Alitibacter langaaensis DSM 22999 TaxID=1122935 RepID=A0A2U0TAH0_9PAST|nr:hypothetical protein [Pasteurella langaaensis]PVX40557.1 hypothetical protein C8D76_103130 [Pasteurella langaaensis DSM 22999]